MENIRPLKTHEDYEWAIDEVTRYFENEPEPGTAESDRFDVLSTLIEAYEDKHYPIEEPDPVSAIAAHMAMTGAKQVALAKIVGSPSRASEILNRKRPLTVEMIYKISHEWGIPTDILVRPYHLDRCYRTKKGASTQR